MARPVWSCKDAGLRGSIAERQQEEELSLDQRNNWRSGVEATSLAKTSIKLDRGLLLCDFDGLLHGKGNRRGLEAATTGGSRVVVAEGEARRDVLALFTHR
ncbi:hypothetical protein NL676_039439 [Syzygium grande]|nr:hypothetical protein NL676_039439 [Syzygium grande]